MYILKATSYWVFAVWMLSILYALSYWLIYAVISITPILLRRKMRVRERGITIVHQYPILLSFWTHVNSIILCHANISCGHVYFGQWSANSSDVSCCWIGTLHSWCLTHHQSFPCHGHHGNQHGCGELMLSHPKQNSCAGELPDLCQSLLEQELKLSCLKPFKCWDCLLPQHSLANPD